MVKGFVHANIQLGDVDDQEPGDGVEDGVEQVGGNDLDTGIDAANENLPPTVVHVQDAKRGELDAEDSDAAVHYTLELASNGKGWQNSFDLRGSVFDDQFVIEVSDTTDLGRWVNKNAADKKNGALTKIVADMGDGDDVYDASGIASTDVVAAGLGLNQVSTGDNFDTIIIDLFDFDALTDEKVGFETIIHDFDADRERPEEEDFDTLVFENFNGGNYDVVGVYDGQFKAKLENHFPGLLDSDGNLKPISKEEDLVKLASALATDTSSVTDAYLVGGEGENLDLVLDFGDLRHVVLKDLVSQESEAGDSDIDLQLFVDAAGGVQGLDENGPRGIIRLANYELFGQDGFERFSRLDDDFFDVA